MLFTRLFSLSHITQSGCLNVYHEECKVAVFWPFAVTLKSEMVPQKVVLPWTCSKLHFIAVTILALIRCPVSNWDVNRRSWKTARKRQRLLLNLRLTRRWSHWGSLCWIGWLCLLCFPMGKCCRLWLRPLAPGQSVTAQHNIITHRVFQSATLTLILESRIVTNF